jgi:tetrahydromethanopterin S-methyltransferase subunit F
MRAAGNAAPRRGMVSLPVLWFGIFGAPAAWALQTIVDYSLVSHYCFPRQSPVRSPSFSGVRGTGFVVSSVVIVVVLVAMVTAFRSWRATRHGHSAKDNELLEVGGERTRFMAFAGLLLSAVFLFAVLMNSLPLITNSVCLP